MLIATIALTTLFVFIKAKEEQHRKLLTLGVPYISIGVGALYWIYYLFDTFGSIPGEKGSFVMTLWFMLMVWGVDIGGYIVGSSLKGPKLAPKISPNKTWSGLVGGVVLAVAVSFIYMFTVKNIFNLPMPLSEQLKFAQLGAMIAIVAQIGDLAESAIKRHLGVKDSSCLLYTSFALASSAFSLVLISNFSSFLPSRFIKCDGISAFSDVSKSTSTCLLYTSIPKYWLNRRRLSEH